MSAVTLLAELAAVLEGLTNEVNITPSRPGASDDCSAVSVWCERIFHSPAGVLTGGDEAECFYRRAYEFRYRIDLCYPPRDDGKEYTPSEYLSVSTEFYDLADQAWCDITTAASEGLLFSGADCEDIVVGAQINEISGDRVSAEGSVLVTFPCEVGS